jgi:glyoxylase-like metal-dependent hydrolase (beta-lactamase superfamily II)/rhodanese-related sulfurtransferase
MSSMPFLYTARQMMSWLSDDSDIMILDVRNEKDFNNFALEGPCYKPYINIPYYDFIEDVDASCNMVPAGQKVRIVCAKENSAKFVAEKLVEHGLKDVGYMEGGIVSWGNMLAPELISDSDFYKLYQMIRPGKASCSYLLIAGKEAAVFDPSRNLAAYEEIAEKNGAKIIKTFETHRQADYISGSVKLKKEKGIELIAGENDFKGGALKFTPAGNKQNFALTSGPEILSLHTPGHTTGSTCFIIDKKYLISGDTIFIQSTGRPDLGGKCDSWSRLLYLTLMITLRNLDDNISVLPGHYSSWGEANTKRPPARSRWV